MVKEGFGFLHVRRTIFYTLARCLNAVMDTENRIHTCDSGDTCAISLLLKVFQYMKGNGQDVDIRVMDWIGKVNDFRYPFQLLRVLFENSQSCGEKFFSPLIAQTIEQCEKDCECQYMLVASQFKVLCITLRKKGKGVATALGQYWRCTEQCKICNVDKIHVRDCVVYPRVLCFRMLPGEETNVSLEHEMELDFKHVKYKFRAAITIAQGDFNEYGNFIPYLMEGDKLFTWKSGTEKIQVDFKDLEGLMPDAHMIFFERCMEVSRIRKTLSKSDVEYNSYLLLPFREVEACLEKAQRGKESREVLQFHMVIDFDTKLQYEGLQLIYGRDGYRFVGKWKKIVSSMRLEQGQTIEMWWDNSSCDNARVLKIRKGDATEEVEEEDDDDDTQEEEDDDDDDTKEGSQEDTQENDGEEHSTS